MSRTRVLVLWLVVGLTVGRPGPEASAGEIADDLSAVARPGPGGRGSVAARKATDRLARRRITGLFQELKMTVRVAGLALCSGSEYSCNVVITFDIRFLREIQIATIGLALTRKRGL